MKKPNIAFLVFFVITAFVLNSCTKWFSGAKDNEAALLFSQAEGTYNEIGNISNQAINGELVFYKSNGVSVYYSPIKEINPLDGIKTNCNVNIYIDTTSSISTMIVDWGEANCDCNDGKKRRGKIKTTWTGSYFEEGTIITHTPEGYYVNDNKVEGVMTVENMGHNTLNQPYYNVQVDGVVTFNTGKILEFSSTRVRTFTSGYTTPLFFMDDEYDITGTAYANIVDQNDYEALITSPLHIKIGCPFITKGILNFTPTGASTRIVDYGDGTCDGVFTYTVDGTTYTINV